MKIKSVINVSETAINIFGIALGINITLEDMYNILGIVVLALNVIMILWRGIYKCIDNIKNKKNMEKALVEAQNTITQLENLIPKNQDTRAELTAEQIKQIQEYKKR